MSSNTPAGQIIESLLRFRKWWLFPTLICTFFAVVYALCTPKSYTSRQTLIIRDDLVGTFYKPGRFDSLDSMKSAQETILEVSRRPQVVRAALEKLGPPAMTGKDAWLGEENIEKIQGKIQISAPNGAEFGRTEAIVLSVSQNSRQRSGEFIVHLLDEMDKCLRKLRSKQFDSMRNELSQAADIADESYSKAAAKLKKFEENVGADLSTLISLNDSQAGTNNLQSELGNLSIEQRKAWSKLEEVKKQIEILGDVSGNPEALIEVPQELLQLQPTLAHLARGLNESILKYAKSKGRYQESHPLVRADAREVEDIKQRMNDKLTRALGSLNRQLELHETKYQNVTSLIAAKKSRLAELSGMRVDYETLKAEVGKKREVNGKAQASLAEIESLGGAAENIDLIARIDEAQTEIYADGPSNKLIVFGGMAAGLFMGLGMVMFVAPLDGPVMPIAPIGPGGDDIESANAVPTNRNNETENRELKESNLPAESSSFDPTPIVPEEPSSGHRRISDHVVAPQANQPLNFDETSPAAENEKPESESPLTAEPFADAPVEAEDAFVSPPFVVEEEAASAESADSGTVESQEEPAPEFSWLNPQRGSDDAESVRTEACADQVISDQQLESFFDNVTSVDSPSSELAESELFEDALNSLGEESASFEDAENDELPNQMDSPIPIGETLTPNPDELPAIQVPVIDEFDSALLEFEEQLSTAQTTDEQHEREELTAGPKLIGPVDKNSGDSEPSVEELESEDLDLDEASILATEDLSEEVLARLRVGQAGTSNLLEKVSQLDQNEIIITDEFDIPIESITQIGDFSEAPEAVDPPPAEKMSTELPLETSIQNSSEASATGNESDPGPGNQQPENRPTATTVDLRMLKDQLAGKGKSESKKRTKTLSDVLNQSKDLPEPKPDPAEIDQDLSDLANSIRDMCKKPDPSE